VEAPVAALRQDFLGAMSQAACTVNVVTTDGPAGRAGVTVSAMSSVSADSPLPTLLVCVHHASAAARAILANGVFCVNMLRDDQAHISERFAGRLGPGERFDCARWTVQKTGAPRVVDPLVAFDCRLISGERVGTHHVFIGAVEDIFIADDGAPLIYANRAYGTPMRLGPVGTAAYPRLTRSPPPSTANYNGLAPVTRSRHRDGAAGAARSERDVHQRIRPFNTRDTYPEQRLDNDLCQAVVARGRIVFLRGQCPQDLDTAANVGLGDPTAQAHKVMQNIVQLIAEAGGTMAHLTKLVVYLTDIRHREAVYRVMGEYIRGVHPVCTGLVVVALARPEWLVEIDATAVIPDEA